jgi:hypothetical protein
MKNLLSQVTLDGVTRKKDKSITLRFITQLEQTSEQLMQMDKLLNDSGTLFFKPNGNLTKEELDALEESKIENQGKSKSQRLRSVLYILYTQRECSNEKSPIYLDFKTFYSNEMERLIDHYKSKLTD